MDFPPRLIPSAAMRPALFLILLLTATALPAAAQLAPAASPAAVAPGASPTPAPNAPPVAAGDEGGWRAVAPMLILSALVVAVVVATLIFRTRSRRSDTGRAGP